MFQQTWSLDTAWHNNLLSLRGQIRPVPCCCASVCLLPYSTIIWSRYSSKWFHLTLYVESARAVCESDLLLYWAPHLASRLTALANFTVSGERRFGFTFKLHTCCCYVNPVQQVMSGFVLNYASQNEAVSAFCHEGLTAYWMEVRAQFHAPANAPLDKVHVTRSVDGLIGPLYPLGRRLDEPTLPAR
jgi:hypothetical protein